MIDNDAPGTNTSSSYTGNGSGDASATVRLKAAGIDTDRMASRAGELTQLIREEIAAQFTFKAREGRLWRPGDPD